MKRKGVGVEDDEIEGPVAPQNAPNVEIFEPGAKFMSIPVTHESRAAEDVKISQNAPNIKLENVRWH